MAGRWITSTIISTNLELNNQPVEHCSFNADTYTNPDPDALLLARQVLNGYGAVIIAPK